MIDRKTDNMNWHENIPRDFHRVNRSWSHVRTADRSKRRAVTTAVKRSLSQESGHYRRRAVTILGSSRWGSASSMFVNNAIDTFHVLRRKNMSGIETYF